MSNSFAPDRGRSAVLGLRPGRASNLGFAIACVLVPTLILLAALALRERYAVDLPVSSTPLVVIHAGDFSYRMPDTVPAGLVRLRLIDEGQTPHHAVLTRLEPGQSAAGYLRGVTSWMKGGAFPGWGDDPGGPGLVMPGDTAEVAVRLVPGHYLIACFMASPEGVPHFAMGMTRQFDVVATSGATPDTPPAAAVTVDLSDFAFDVSAPLAAGRHWIHIVNGGVQEHEVQLIRILPGHTADEAMTWLRERQGPPPFRFEGGVSGLARGRDAYLFRDLSAGDYLLLSLIPDRVDRAPQVTHGMQYLVHVGVSSTS